ncbi:hypothetical protein E5720_16500 [Rhodococcus sp. PAMC28707]|uniref:hypothetical protein n=1 Tax=unclassified Rhodococcus (in: high G+C Gram-positive bacteria) TaxID=192944 RepID=UPI00109DC2A6|nr:MULTISPECIES: hypothetical protein [unclassified Rhodococcus (in: high G+C Gram-positive bacteria)]QCB51976.1 hypothetical protein E5769_19020 [Rhodococcus sp. PAMC28705]QCB59854.1 hypothetical protein E5720_16500 [Rhodococcus sp. PAMC28707]
MSSRPRSPQITNPDVTYGVQADQLVFVEQSLAEELVLLRTGVATWGEAKAKLNSTRWQQITEKLADVEISVPDDDQLFALDDIPGHLDGDWPEWPAQLMLTLVPNSIVEKYGKKVDSVLNGQFLEFDAADEKKIVAEMNAAGFTCIKDDSLVAAASGF